jgi:hypothetical protein
MEAELTSTAMMQLEPHLAEDEQGIYLTIAGDPIRLLRAVDCRLSTVD